MGLDDGLDEPLDLFGPRVEQLVVEDFRLLNDGEGVVGGAGTRVRLCRWAAQPQPRGKEGHPGRQMVFWGLVDFVGGFESRELDDTARLDS